MGLGLIKSIGTMLKADAPTNKIKAYHGSPHSFDRFSTDAIGTGEGAQAYGQGLYFAEREGTALSYRDALTPRDLDYEEDLMRKYNAAESNGDYARMEMLERAMTHDTPSDFRDLASDTDYDEDYRQLASDMADEIESTGTNFGSMYEVEIDVEDADLLNWDVLLDEQPQKVQDALRKTDWYEDAEARVYESAGNRGDNPYGADLLRDLEEDGPEYAAEALREAGIQGVKYADALTRFSKNKTNNYVIFNDEYVDIARKYGIGAASTLGATAALSPQDAEAGGLSTGRRIIDSRFTNALGGGPRKGLQDAVETMGARVDQRDMDMGAESNLYDFEGSPYILTQSDRSAAGGTLTGIYDKDIDPVNLRGGRDYMFDPDTRDLVWASDPNVVSGLAKRAAQLRKEFGKDPILLPYSMAPTGIDFATMPLDTMINYARQGMSKANVKKLDTQIKKFMPEWTSVMDPSANAMFRNVPGDKRKAVANIIDKNFRNLNGGLSISEARAATTDSGQYMTPDGTLRNVGIIDTSRPIGTSDHPTYRGGLPGEGVGTLKEDLNVRPFMENAGRTLTGDAADIRSLSMNPSFSQGVIDEKLLRKIYDTQGERLQGIAAKFGVSIPVAALAIMGTGYSDQSQAAHLSGAASTAIKKGYIDQVSERGAGILDAGANIVSGAVAPIIQGLQHFDAMGTPNPDGSTKSLAQLKAQDSELDEMLNYDIRTERGQQMTDRMLQGVADTVIPAVGALDEGLLQADNFLPGQPYQQAKDSAGKLYDWYNKQDEKTRMHIGKLMDILP